MSTKRHKIVLLSSGRHLHAEEGQTLLHALIRTGIQLRADCGGKGACGKCLVQIRPEMDIRPPSQDQVHLAEQHQPLVERLACQTSLDGDLAIEIPLASLAYAEVIAKPTFMRSLAHASVVPGQTAASNGYGLAVDLGTTTIAVFLFDPQQGQVLASGSMRNSQVIFGDDVMSRISAVTSDRANLTGMQKLVVDGVNHTAVSLADQCGIEAEDITKTVVVGNSTMIHLFLGEDPSSIGFYPFQPVFSNARELAATNIGLALHSEARLNTLPLISGFLGSDIIAAAMASEVDRAAEETMIVDVGTNGEIMLNVRGDLIAASCATGPALEGAAISHGMHAVSGAIDSMRIDPEDSSVRYSLIQSNPDEPRKAAGICGSGIVSAVAALLKAGVILMSGRFNLKSNHPNLRHDDEGRPEFVLVPGAETQTGVDITLTQGDIRAVQLAKGAILTGITLLCQEVQIELPQRLLIAGAFGSFLNKDDAITIGMLPRLVDHSLETVGNAAGEGAVLALFNGNFEERARDIARRTRVVDLASHPDFQKVFLNSLAFPDI